MGGTAYARAHIAARAREDMKAKVAKHAEKHTYGKGIGNKILLQPARRAQRHLRRQGKNAEAIAIDYIVTGCLNDPEPAMNGKYKNEHMCHRCGGNTVATRWHELYGCPDNDNIDDPVMKKTAWAPKVAKANWDREPCLWARGLLLAAWYEDDSTVDFIQAKVWATSRFSETLAETRRAYSDGAGGPRHIPAVVRKVGCGAATFKGRQEGTDVVLDDVEGICGEVPGAQTVPRAEVWGAALTLASAPLEGTMHLGIDAAYVVNGNSRRGQLTKGANGDLWAILFDLIDK